MAMIDDEATVKRIKNNTKKHQTCARKTPFLPTIETNDRNLRLLGVVSEIHRYLEGVPSTDV